MPNTLKDIERRFVPATELRIAEKNGKKFIQGYSALFNVLSDDLGGFKERIAPGAFSDVLTGDTWSLFNHNPDNILGRTTAGTLTLKEDDRGLFMETELPDTDIAGRVITHIERGDVSQQSFGFITLDASWDTVDGIDVRTLKKVKDLLDVGPVIFAAYPQTSVGLRSLLADAGLDNRFLPAIVRITKGLDLRSDDRAVIEAFIETLAKALPEAQTRQAGPDSSAVTIHSLEILKRQLELKARMF